MDHSSDLEKERALFCSCVVYADLLRRLLWEAGTGFASYLQCRLAAITKAVLVNELL